MLSQRHNDGQRNKHKKKFPKLLKGKGKGANITGHEGPEGE
jgi:hypothetical protein